MMITLPALAMAVLGSAPQQSAVLYAPGRTIKDQAITLRSWGSGTISETDEVALEGKTSLRVATRNYFQGGIIKFGQPQDLSQEFDDKTNLLRLTFMVADNTLVLGGPEAGGRPAGKAGGAMGGDSAGGGPARGAKPSGGNADQGTQVEGHAGRPGGGITPFATSTTPEKMGRGDLGPAVRLSIRQMRLIVTTTDGKKSEAYVPVGTSTTAAGLQGWRSVAVPLSAIRGFERTNKIVQEIAISADMVASIYVGDIRIVSDATPVRGEVNTTDLNLALGDEVTLSAIGYAGSSVLQYKWDFDASDGIQVDAEGPVVKRKFRKPGTFTVTVTISDLYGLKQPFVTTFKAKVNP